MHPHAYVLQESSGKGKNMKKNNIKRSQLIAKRKKQFFALVLSVILAIMPTTTVMAFEVKIHNDSIPNFRGRVNPDTDKIVWEMDNNVPFATGKIEGYI